LVGSDQLAGDLVSGDDELLREIRLRLTKPGSRLFYYRCRNLFNDADMHEMACDEPCMRQEMFEIFCGIVLGFFLGTSLPLV
jgi:hypothetical protein